MSGSPAAGDWRGRVPPSGPGPFRSVPDGAALYLHVPFCEEVCDFCAFSKARPGPGDWRRFREGLVAEWSGVSFEGRASSAFWGGGTPGLLKAADIRRIGLPFREVLRSGAEWTVELTPRCVTREKLAAWRDAGVNRISLGVQSFEPRLLEAMGRPYPTHRVRETVERIREAGFERLNIDLIIAFPGQTPAELEEDVRKAVSLAPDHVSAYCLTLEEDTPLYLRLARNRKSGGSAGDPEEEADLFRRAWAGLEEAGYRQYEISNFARPGGECAHHLNVWRMGQWRGFGPSAASQIGGVRFRNASALSDWHRAAVGGGDAFEDVVRLTALDRIRERIVFGLRLNEGIEAPAGIGLPGEERSRLDAFLALLGTEGLLERAGSRLRLTLSGRLVADEIGRRILCAGC